MPVARNIHGFCAALLLTCYGDGVVLRQLDTGYSLSCTLCGLVKRYRLVNIGSDTCHTILVQTVDLLGSGALCNSGKLHKAEVLLARCDNHIVQIGQ